MRARLPRRAPQLGWAALLLGALLFAAAAPVAAQRLERVRVIDGDTIQDLGRNVTYRLVNIDTPEVGRNARCEAERALGARATQRTRALIRAADAVETRPVGRRDSYGRTVAFVLIDGRDLGETLVAEGLARPWRGRRRPWCGLDGALIP